MKDGATYHLPCFPWHHPCHSTQQPASAGVAGACTGVNPGSHASAEDAGGVGAGNAAADNDASSDWDAFSDDADSAAASTSSLSESGAGCGGPSSVPGYEALVDSGGGGGSGARRSRERSLFGVAEKRESAPFRYTYS